MAKPCRYPGCPALVHEPRNAYCAKHGAAIRRPCATPRCPNLVSAETRYCPSCQEERDAAYERARESAGARGYDSTWRKVRAAYLASNPLCESCLRAGKTVAAVMVHHREAITEGGERLDPSNLESRCTECHERVHGRRWQR